MMKYEQFSAEEFALDDLFIRWVLASDPATDEFWEQWTKEHPEKLETIHDARELVLLAARAGHMPTETQVERMRKNIHDRVNKSHADQLVRKLPVEGTYNKTWWYRAAAVVALLLISGTVFWFSWSSNKAVMHHTQFAETKNILLPDGSEVVLNANSKLRYEDNWQTTGSREVWLEGEAFFSVTHQSNNQKFIVHTDKLAVEVLGTTFNVWQREDRAKVVLCTGKIRLLTPEQSEIEMKPGQLVQVDNNEPLIIRESVNTSFYTSWKENKLIFDHTPLRDVADLIENQYGRPVVIRDTSLLRQELTLKLPHDDLPLLLQSLEKLFKVEVIEANDTIILENY